MDDRRSRIGIFNPRYSILGLSFLVSSAFTVKEYSPQGHRVRMVRQVSP